MKLHRLAWANVIPNRNRARIRVDPNHIPHQKVTLLKPLLILAHHSPYMQRPLHQPLLARRQRVKNLP